MKTLLAITFVLMVGAAGVTVAAAQGSQPGEPIHAIKVLTEQARTFLQTRTQVQAAQVTGQPAGEAGLAEPDRIQLQTQDMQQDQDRDRIQLQTQDMLQTQEQLQTQERDRLQLQTQDMLQTRDRIQQSSGSGQQSQVGDSQGQGNNGAGMPHPQDHGGNGPNSVDGNQP